MKYSLFIIQDVIIIIIIILFVKVFILKTFGVTDAFVLLHLFNVRPPAPKLNNNHCKDATESGCVSMWSALHLIWCSLF